MLGKIGGAMYQKDDRKIKKHLSVTLLLAVYFGVLAYLSNYIV